MDDNPNRTPAGRFDYKPLQDSEVGLQPSRYAGLAPTVIDAELAGYHGTVREIDLKIWDHVDEIIAIEDFVRRGSKSRYRSWADPEKSIADSTARMQELNLEKEEFTAEYIDPIDDEFRYRGGWNRFFLVTSSAGGHVHSSMDCSTCEYRTRFIWLTDESGKSEDEIVEKAGDGACSRCYPSAPVRDKAHPRPNPFEDPEVTANRLQRQMDKDARAAKALITGITKPGGGELREADRVSDDGTVESRGYAIGSARTAETLGVDYLYNSRRKSEYRERQDRQGEAESSWDRQDRGTYEIVVEALAAKRGQTTEEIEALLLLKATKKYKRDFGT